MTAVKFRIDLRNRRLPLRGFDNDHLGLTIGGGAITNPGRYLVLLPAINGASESSGSAYFSQSPGDQFKAWDSSITFQIMPNQYITFRTELGYRHSSVPYWTGHGGITPPGGNNGSPSQYVCSTTSTLGGGVASGFGFGNLAAAESSCGGQIGAKAIQNVSCRGCC